MRGLEEALVAGGVGCGCYGQERALTRRFRRTQSSRRGEWRGSDSRGQDVRGWTSTREDATPLVLTPGVVVLAGVERGP